jgi:Family of unknown function (DUF6600)
MRSSRLVPHRFFSLFLILFLTLITANVVAYADDEDEGESYEEQARVVRISLIKGEVTLKRKGNTDWERARVNFPLVEGDTVSTDRESQLELQIDARNFVRLGSNSMLSIQTLRDEGVALSVIEGLASIRLAKFDRDKEYFEIDAPQSTLAAERTGLYRIDVVRGSRVRFTVNDGGRARIYSETSGFALRSGRAAELINDGPSAGDWEMFAAAAPDSWDDWVVERERYLAQRFRYDTDRYDSYVWGAEDLDAYGNWSYVNDYGWIWRPHINVINNYNNWAPYRYGTWTWVWPYGWTWVGYEPWGWAPYHYGRWVYYNNYWAWCPRSHYYRHRSWWRPALVAFHISIGNHVSWYPLSYRHRDPRSRHYDGWRGPNTRGSEPEPKDLGLLRAVTTTNASDFGSDVGFRSVNEAVARRIAGEEPVKGDLPLRPANIYRQNPEGTVDVSTRITAAKPAVKPAAEIVERPTGAAIRKVGLPLDAELRRSRVFGGRELKSVTSESDGKDAAIESSSTGAVTRPAKTIPKDSIDPNGSVQPGTKAVPQIPRADTTDDTGVIKRDQAYGGKREPIDEDTGVGPPKRPKIQVQPKVRDDSPSRNDEPSVRKQEQPSRSEPAPRYEPPKNSEPPRKYEPPPRSEPAPRYEPPPQRSEPPQRSAPAPKSDPPPQKSEPAKVQPPKKVDPN